jgi:hypothetical protein
MLVKQRRLLKFSGLRIRIHFIRIRIQHFRLNTDPDPDLIRIRIQYGSGSNTEPDPDPIRIQGFNDQRLKNITAEKKIKFFFIKNYNLPIPRPP